MNPTIVIFLCFIGWFLFVIVTAQIDPDNGSSIEQNVEDLLPMIMGITVISAIIIYMVHWIIFCVAATAFIIIILLCIFTDFDKKNRNQDLWSSPVHQHVNVTYYPPDNPPKNFNGNNNPKPNTYYVPTVSSRIKPSVNRPIPNYIVNNLMNNRPSFTQPKVPTNTPGPLYKHTSTFTNAEIPLNIPDVLYKGISDLSIGADIFSYQRFKINPDYKPNGVWCADNFKHASGYTDFDGCIVVIDISLIKHLVINAFDVMKHPDYETWVNKYGDSGSSYSSFVINHLRKKLIYIKEDVYVIPAYHKEGVEYHGFDNMKVTTVLDQQGIPIIY